MSRFEQRHEAAAANGVFGGELCAGDFDERRVPVEAGRRVIDHRAGTDDSGPLHDRRNLQRVVVHVGPILRGNVRRGFRQRLRDPDAVALVVNAVVPHVVTVVRREDDDGFPAQVQLVQ